LRLLW